jgi:AraC family transcriptional regulator
MSSANSISIRDERNSHHLNPQDFGNSTLEIQPGLIACLSTSVGTNSALKEVSFPGDNEYIHLNCLLKGRFEARVKGISLECMPGDVSMGFSAGEVFYVKNGQEFSNFELMVTPEVLFNLAGEELAGLDFDKKMAFFVKNGCPCKRVTTSAMQITHLMQEKPRKHLLLHAAILDYLYWHLIASKSDNKEVLNISTREKKQLLAAKIHLLHDLSCPPTIAEIANSVGLNQCKLKKGFKSLFGTSIYALFQEERMHKAMGYLKNNNVTETAMLLGYSNVSHFSSAFRKQFGLLPKEARKEIEPDFAEIIHS